MKNMRRISWLLAMVLILGCTAFPAGAEGEMKLAAMMFAVALAGVTLGQACGSPCAKSCGVRADNELVPEKELSFRHRLEEVHEPGLRDLSLKAGVDEFAFVDGSEIAYVGEPSPYMKRAIGDFVDFMKVSMGLRLVVKEGEGKGEGENCVWEMRRHVDARRRGRE